MRQVQPFGIAVFFIFAVAISAATGCGGAPTKTEWKPKPLAPEADWDGVFHSDFGRMELSVQNDTAVGLYEGDAHFGRIEGKIDGNLLFFAWTQYNEDMQGRYRESNGRGVFKYKIKKTMNGERERVEHIIKGTWGYGEAEVGNIWNGRKLPRSKKRLKPRTVDIEAAMDVGGEEEDYSSSAGFDAVQEEEESTEEVGFTSSDDEEDEDDPLDDLF